MSKIKKMAKSRVGIIFIIAFLTILGTVAFVSTQGKRILYQIEDSRITIYGRGGAQWEMEASAFPFEGEFTVERGELQSIENVSFDVPTNWLRSADFQIESMVKEVLQANNCNRIRFEQRRGMILPIMKKIHLVGDMGFGKTPQAMAFQASYTQNSDNEIAFEAIQEVSLSSFGIQIPQEMTQYIDDKVEIKIQIRLVKNLVL